MTIKKKSKKYKLKYYTVVMKKTNIIRKKNEQSEKDTTEKSKNQIITDKSIRLLQQNQYTSYVDSKLTKTEMKKWIEQFFNVRVDGINTSQFKRDTKNKSKLNVNCRSRKKMIARLRPNHFIPLFLN